MQIAPIGAAEVALANLSTGMSAQQIAAAASSAQPGGVATAAAKEKQQVGKTKQVEKSEQAVAGQQLAQAGQNVPAAGTAGSSSARAEATEVLTERQLFDYLAEAEKSAGGRFSGPSELFGSALQSIDSTMQQVQSVLSKAKPEGATAPATDAGQPTVLADAGQAGKAAEAGESDPAKLLERSISVMWAAANLEVVVSSVTAVSSSAGTLVKQQ